MRTWIDDACMLLCFISLPINIFLFSENLTIKNTARQFSLGYDEFFKKPGPDGQPLGAYLVPNKVGLFVVKNKGTETIYACGKVLDGAIVNSKH